MLLKNRTPLKLVLIFTFLTPSLPAAELAYEGWNYANDTTHGDGTPSGLQTGGTGWISNEWIASGGNANTHKTRTTGLSYTGLQTSGGALLDPETNKKQGSYRNFTLNDPTNTNTSRFVSFLFRLDSGEDFATETFYIGLNNSAGNATNSGAIDGMAITSLSGSNYTVAAKSGGYLSGTDVNLTIGQTYLFVIEAAERATNSQEFLNLWINPDIYSADAPSIVDSQYAGNLTLGDASQFAFGTKGDNMVTYDDALTFTLDEIRIGDTFTDVTPVPEASSLALMLGLVCSLATARRKPRSA